MTRTETPVLPPLHASEVTELESLPEWMLSEPVVPDGAGSEVLEYTSERGRIFAVTDADGGSTYLLEQDIHWNEKDDPVPTATRAYRSTTSGMALIENDCLRLFVSQAVRYGLAEEFAGWRDRLVVLVPEADGLESTIYSVLADGVVVETEAKSPLAAYEMYAQKVQELAAEFESTKWHSPHLIEQSAPFDGRLVHAWLVREASRALLSQAQQSLKARLAAEAGRSLQEKGLSKASVSELARSFHTDRPNLSKMIKVAEIESREYELRRAASSRPSI